MKKNILGLSVLGAVALISGCGTTKLHSWMDPRFEGRAIGKTAVMAIADSESIRRQYESLFVGSLLERGVSSEPLQPPTNTADAPGKEKLAAELRANHFDSILITRVISSTDRNQVVATGYYATPYNTYWGYYDYGCSLSCETATVTSFMEFVLETNLYDVETERLVWSGRKSVYDTNSDRANMESVIRSVVKDLGKKGLL